MATRSRLNPGEVIVADIRPHWSFLARPFAVVIALLAAGSICIDASPSAAIKVPVAVVLGGALAWLVGRHARWATTTMLITNERLIQRAGVLAKRAREVPLGQIGEIECRRRIRDRLIGAGDVVVTSATGGRVVFAHLGRPQGVVRELQRQIELSGRDGWSPDAPALSHRAELDHLEELRRSGALSQAEFEARRARLGPR